MKAFFVAFLAVAAADPAVYLSGVNPSVYTAGVIPQVYGVQPSVYTSGIIPAVQPMVPSTYIKPEVQAKKVTQYVEKQENKVNPELYNKVEKKVEYEHRQPIHTVVSSYSGLPITTYAGVPVAVNPTVTKKYEAKSGPVEHTVINKEHLIYKREAEAEADPLLYINRPFGYSGIYNPVTYTTPLTYNYGVVPTRYGHPLAGFGAKTYANDAVRPENYANKRNYIAENAGAVHYAKREAEAESDPALLLRSPYYSTLGYRYPATTYTSSAYTYPYTTYGYPTVRSVYGF